MRSNIQIIPAILATTEKEYQVKLKKIEAASEFLNDWVQIDLMDNKFVQNQSIGVEILGRFPTTLKREVHLMVEYPENWIDELVKLRAERIVFPVEDNLGIKERIKHIKNHGLEVGLAVNPETPVAKVMPFIDTIDLVVLMSVRPGFGGQEFIPETIDKVKGAVLLRTKSRNFLIEVDGGINETNARDLVEAGADNIVIGEYLINGDVLENLTKIREAIKP